jgi:hypothetical protein
VQLLHQIPVASRGQVEIRFAGLLCLLLKAVQHVDDISKLGYVDHPKRSFFLPNPYFADARPDHVHRLPVIRVAALLHLVDLMASLPTGTNRKVAEVVQGTSPEFNGLGAHGHRVCIQKLVCIDAQEALSTEMFASQVAFDVCRYASMSLSAYGRVHDRADS